MATVAGSAISCVEVRAPRVAGRRQGPGGHRAVDEGHRGEEAADLLADELQVEQRRAASAQLLGDADGRAGHLAEGGPEVRIEAARLAGAHDIRRAAVGEEGSGRPRRARAVRL